MEPQQTALSFQQIFNTLLAGKKLLLHFESAAEAETFRVRMHHFKSRQERTLEALGAQSEDMRTVFRFQVKGNPEGGEDVAAMAAFAVPEPVKKYAVLILDEEGTGN